MDEEPAGILAASGAVLADAIEAALPGWVRDQVGRVLRDQAVPSGPEIEAAVAAAGALARSEVGAAVRRLLAADVDQQDSTPLSLLRSAVAYPTAVLEAAGAEPAARDRFRAEAFPDDPYDLTPAAVGDLAPDDPALAEAALAWGAAKAFVHRRRHQGGR